MYRTVFPKKVKPIAQINSSAMPSEWVFNLTKDLMTHKPGTGEKWAGFDAHDYNVVIVWRLPWHVTDVDKLPMGNRLCPNCGTALISADLTKRRCLACHCYIAFSEESLEDICKVRTAAKVYSYELDHEKNPQKPIVFWDPGQKWLDVVYTPQSL